MSDKLSEPLVKTATCYKNLTNEEQKNFLTTAYVELNISMGELAILCRVSPTTIKKHLGKYGLKIKTLNEARAILYQEGRSNLIDITKRPDLKDQIGKKTLKRWMSKSAEEKAEFSERKKQFWIDNEDKKEEITKEGMKAIKATHKYGSKLEKFLSDELIKAGFLVERHKKHRIVNSLFHLDLFLPEIPVAIEVDGVMHSLPIVGDKALEDVKIRDKKKNGLLIGSGVSIIRVKYYRKYATARARHVLKYVLHSVKMLKERSKLIDFEPEVIILENDEWKKN